MSRRMITLIAVGAGVVLGVAGCGTDKADRPSAQPPAGAESTTAPADATTPPEQRTSLNADGKGCPVDAKTLLAAMTNATNPGAVSGLKLSKIECSDGFAIATADRGADFEPETEVFKLTNDQWKYLQGGTADYCKGVSTEAKQKFQAKNYDSCD